MLAPGARLVLVKNPAAFATRYPTNNINVIAWTSGNLARSGETLSLVDPGTNNILTFTYSRLWYPETYDTGYSLVAVDLAAAEPLWSTPGNWRPSRVPLGTPGPGEPPAFTNARVTADRLLVDVVGLEGTVELWFSEDLVRGRPATQPPGPGRTAHSPSTCGTRPCQPATAAFSASGSSIDSIDGCVAGLAWSA